MAYISFQPSDYFNTKLYTGNGSTNAITSVGFEPSWTWIKNRGDTHAHVLVDAVRGVTKELRSSGTNAEITTSNSFTSFDSDGFTLGADSTDSYNKNTNNYVSWNWLANGAGSSNTDGSISSTVSANTTAGFSIVKWTGDGTKGATVGHGLGVKPAMIIARDYAQSKHWFVYHQKLTDNYVMTLNSNEEEKTGDNYWGSGSLMKSASSPTTTTFSFNGSGSSITNINGNGYTNIAYCFAEKKGFSKFGSYTGNGNADGTFVYTGFKPAFVLIKSVSTTNWNMFDNKRSAFNVADETLWANSSDSESTVGTGYGIDILSNGFKPRSTSSQVNFNNTQMVYMAIAEAPLVGSNNVPATAR